MEPASFLAPRGRAPGMAPRIWQVGALCRAIADALESRFNPVAVRGEISGFSRAPSGHCYFSLKDPNGQIRCAMFRRAASLMDFQPRDGDLVEVQGRLGVYEARGDLQLIVENLRRAGQGALFEQFLQLKARLEEEGLFDPARKRELPALPRGIGIVTSLNAAALHDVVTSLRRRAPHVPVLLAPAAVQGPQAPGELMAALRALYLQAEAGHVDVILLVRGGGSMEDLWAFNDERLARTVVRSPVPLVCGVGHETDFTIADFCADVRAPTPTAAAELAASPREQWLEALAGARVRLRDAAARRLDRAAQRLDHAASRLGRPQADAARQEVRLERMAQRLRQATVGRAASHQLRFERDAQWLQVAVQARLASAAQADQRAGRRFVAAAAQRLRAATRQLDDASLRLQLLDPRLVLQRGYALLSDQQGHVVSSVRQAVPGQQLLAALADGEVAVTVSPGTANPP